MFASRLVFFSLLLVFLVSCVEIVDKSRPVQQNEDLTQRAEKAFDRGDYLAAASDYRQYLSQNPNTPRRESLLAMAGLSGQRAGQYAQAAESFSALTREFPSGSYASEVRTAIPDLYLMANQPRLAATEAERLISNATDPQTVASLRLSQGRAAYALGSYWDSFVDYIQAMASPSTSTREAAQRGVEASLLNFSQDQLISVARQYGQNFPGPEACWYLAWAAALSGDQNLLIERVNYFRQYFSSHPWAPKLAALTVDPNSPEAQPPGQGYDPKPQSLNLNLGRPASQPAQNAVSPGTFGGMPGQVLVAALLPLSNDSSAKFARDIIDGLRLALAPMSGRVGVLEIDSLGDPGEVVKRVYEMAENPSVLAIVGPLTSREALAAAQTASNASIPLIAISQRQGLTDARPSVFRIFLTPKLQAESVARYATKKLGLKRLGILYPNDVYGQAMLSFFQNEVQLQGAQLTVNDSYSPEFKDWSEAVNRLTGGQSIRRASSNYQAAVDFEALYMPDSAPTINQILPLLAYHDLTKMIYLGSPLWITEDLSKNSGRYLSQSVIPVAYSELSERPEAVAFLESFTRTTGRAPDQFAAYGYDAGVALMTLFNRGAGTRSEIINGLLSLGPFPGATGPFSFTSEGDYQIEPILLTVEGSSFKILEEPVNFR
jgi:ABC-type branched-subunit amino acid transport system substrate-binding protein